MHPDLGQRLAAALADQPRVLCAAVFGSCARATADSEAAQVGDVDILLILEGDDGRVRVAAEAALGRAARRAVDVIVPAEAPPLLRFEIARDGIVLVERRPGLWARFRAQAMIDWWDWAPTARAVNGVVLARLAGHAAPGGRSRRAVSSGSSGGQEAGDGQP